AVRGEQSRMASRRTSWGLGPRRPRRAIPQGEPQDVAGLGPRRPRRAIPHGEPQDVAGAGAPPSEASNPEIAPAKPALDVEHSYVPATTPDRERPGASPPTVGRSASSAGVRKMACSPRTPDATIWWHGPIPTWTPDRDRPSAAGGDDDGRRDPRPR